MAKSKFEEMMDRLPSHIKETEILREETKKVLAALLDLLLHSQARETRIIYCPNSRLRRISGVGSDKLLSSIQQLIDYNLISRKAGTSRNKNEESVASEYIINFKKLKEPIVEKTFDDLFGEFDEDVESLEKPISTPTTITTTTTTSTAIATAIASSISTSNTNSTAIASTKSNIISNEDNFDNNKKKEYNFDKIEEKINKYIIGKTEEELFNRKIELIGRLNKNKCNIDNNSYNRFSLTINRIYQEKLELVTAESK